MMPQASHEMSLALKTHSLPAREKERPVRAKVKAPAKAGVFTCFYLFPTCEEVILYIQHLVVLLGVRHIQRKEVLAEPDLTEESRRNSAAMFSGKGKGKGKGKGSKAIFASSSFKRHSRRCAWGGPLRFLGVSCLKTSQREGPIT